jgi:hypothetical protein
VQEGLIFTDGPTGGLYGGYNVHFHTKVFSYNACDTSMNSESDEEVSGDSHMSHGWSPEDVSGVCTSVTLFFLI